MATSFAMAAPGQALPLTELTLRNTLEATTIADQNTLEKATAQLQQWEKSPRYYVLLQSIYLDTSLSLWKARYPAIVQLKNGIEKYWRKTAANAVSQPDKDAIRSRLIDCVLLRTGEEHESKLAGVSVLVYSKIARFEFPNDWPDAITSLIDHIKYDPSDPSKAIGHVPNAAVFALHYLVKELSTGRLARTRAHLQAATPLMFEVLRSRYVANVDCLRSMLNGSPGVEPLEKTMRQSLQCMKVLRRVIIQGYEHPHRDQEVVRFWKITIQFLCWILADRENNRRSEEVAQLLEEHMLQLAKLHHEMARDHPASFALLHSDNHLVYEYWKLAKEFAKHFRSRTSIESALSITNLGTDLRSVDKAKSTEKAVLRGMTIVRECVKLAKHPQKALKLKYQQPQDKQERTEAVQVMEAVLTPRFIQEISETTIKSYLVLRMDDLRDWQEDSEEWETAQEATGDDFDVNLRSCAEKLFLDVAINYKEVVIPPLLNEFSSIVASDKEDVLYKDAVYTAIGSAANVLHEHLNFDEFIRERMVAEVRSNNPGWNILRRRAAIMLGQWVPVKCDDTTKPFVYNIFQHLLSTENEPLNDLVVRITAGKQLKLVLNEYEFKPEHFVPWAENIITSLINLIEEVDSTDTKRAILDTVGVVVESLQQSIAPVALLIAKAIPALWDKSEPLMQQTILTVLARLVAATKADHVPLHELAMPAIRDAMKGGTNFYWMLEDVLDLWANLITYTPTSQAGKELLDLALLMEPLFELGNDNLRKTLEITDAYIMLAPGRLLSHKTFRVQTFRALVPLITTSNAETNGLACKIVETSLRCMTQMGTEQDVIALVSDLVDTGLLPTLLQGLHGSYLAHSTTHGPHATRPPIDGIIETDHLAILARIILGSTYAFTQTLTVCAPNLPQTSHGPSNLETVLRWLLDETFSHFENVGDLPRRKLLCLALTKLLETNSSCVFSNLQSIMTIWTDVVAALREQKGDTPIDALFWGGENVDPLKAAEDHRKEVLDQQDPVRQCDVEAYIKQHVEAAYGNNEGFDDMWVQPIDGAVRTAFRMLLAPEAAA